MRVLRGNRLFLFVRNLSNFVLNPAQNYGMFKMYIKYSEYYCEKLS